MTATKTTKKTKNIYEKLAEARKIVRETKHEKKGKNTYSDYDYFTPEQVEQIVSEACVETNILPLYDMRWVDDKLVQFMELVNLDDLKETLTFQLATARGDITATNQAQQMGGTDTYSERYLKMKVFQIKDNNLDFDSKDNSQSEEEKRVEKAITKLEKATNLAELKKVFMGLGVLKANKSVVDYKEELKKRFEDENNKD